MQLPEVSSISALGGRVLLATVLVSIAGCGRNIEQANQKVAELTEQGQALFDKGQLDEAAAVAQQAMAVEDATDLDAAQALADAVKARRDLEAQSRSAAAGLKFWSQFNVDQLTDFQEKGLRPKGPWAAEWKSLFEQNQVQDGWQTTLESTLPEALARAEQAAWGLSTAPATDPDDGAPAVTPREIQANPDAWYGKEVRIEGVRIGHVTRSAEHGCLVAVTTADGDTYSGNVHGARLVFAAYRDVAYRLERQLKESDDTRATLYCSVQRGKHMTLGGRTYFPRLLIHKVKLTAGPSE